MQARETEFVFLASEEQMALLPRVLRRLAKTVRGKPLRLVQDQYLDTPTCLLMRSGVACRMRMVGKHATLTLKSLTPFRDGLADRVELSEALPSREWNWPGPLPGQVLRNRLLPLTRRLNVDTLFTLIQKRRVYDVCVRDGSILEISADRMRRVGASQRDVLQRIEVELKAGSVESLTAFASDLRRSLKLKAANESKFEYGLRDAGLSAPVLAEGSSLRIRPGDSVHKAAARTLAKYFHRMLWHVPGTRLGINPECLHDMRVSVRRLRAILRLFRSALPPHATGELAEELKWLGQSLGTVRDMDVHIQECSVMLGRLPEAQRKAADKCRCEIGRRREQAYDALRRDLCSPRFKALQKDCNHLIRSLRRPVVDGGGEIEVEGALVMASELRSILNAGRAIVDATPDELLHRLRVRCKRLRYACDTLSGLYGKPVLKMARRLAELQDVLGGHQDAVAVQALIERTIAESASATACLDVAFALGRCAACWQEEQRVRRAVFPDAWQAFDRKKARRSFLTALQR